MRRIIPLALGLMAAALAGASGPAASDEGYRIAGEVAVQHEGRVKPLDTYARLMVKQVYTRETIKLTDSDGKTVARWEPLPALLDWQARPGFWDGQEILAVEYPPLRRKLFEIPAREALQELAASGKLAAGDKARVEAAAKDPEVSSADLKAASALPGVPDALKARLKTIAHKIHPDQKWLADEDLTEGRILIDGRETTFGQWVDSLRRKAMQDEDEHAPELSALEKKATEVWMRQMIYEGLRDGNPRSAPKLDLFITPRPSDAAYLKFIGDAYRKNNARRQGEKAEPFTDLEIDALEVTGSFLKDIKTRDHRLPGTDPEFDARLAEWLREKSAWLPLRVILKAEPAELTRAGFDADKVTALRHEFARVIANEKENPGALSPTAAEGLRKAARDLGESTSVAYFLRKDVKHKTWSDLDPARVAAFASTRDKLASSRALSDEERGKLIASARGLSATMVPYPPQAEMGREVYFNHFAPFYKAPMAYGAAVVLLLMSLGATGAAGSTSAKVGRGLYVGGMVGLLGGMALEICGFYYRVRITGWAPVTNMYETVVWVALMTSVLGLALELIYRKTYAALAASGVSLLATLLAANVSLLDSNIGNLQPVLRDNYWLTIHVLTIVSSYAAFALAMGLGMLGIGYYLTATYRRDVPYGRLAAPLLPSLPMLAIGIGGLIWSYSRGASQAPSGGAVVALGALALVGMMGTIVGLFALIGEAGNRAPAKATVGGLIATAAGVAGIVVAPSLTSPSWWPDTLSLMAPPAILAGLGLAVVLLSRLGVAARSVLVDAVAKRAVPESAEITVPQAAEVSFAASSGGGVATLRKPSVAEIRARESAKTPTIDPRSEAMQATAARIKPLANFTYRAMQVGVLLVAAGTILGGVWADVSWGRFWGWDAKEVWALITLLVYLVPLHGRFAGWVNTFTLIAASVVCFASVLMAWYGVNFVLNTGLHSYGFVEGGGQGVVLTASLAVLAIVMGAAWRRRLASIA